MTLCSVSAKLYADETVYILNSCSCRHVKRCRRTSLFFALGSLSFPVFSALNFGIYFSLSISLKARSFVRQSVLLWAIAKSVTRWSDVRFSLKN